MAANETKRHSSHVTHVYRLVWGWASPLPQSKPFCKHTGCGRKTFLVPRAQYLLNGGRVAVPGSVDVWLNLKHLVTDSGAALLCSCEADMAHINGHLFLVHFPIRWTTCFTSL